MKTIKYDLETVTNKIETAIYKMDKELSMNPENRQEIYAKTIGRIEGIVQNAKAQIKINKIGQEDVMGEGMPY